MPRWWIGCTLVNYFANSGGIILVPRGCALFGQHQELQPLAWSNDIPALNGFVNTIDWDQDQSDLSDLTLSMRKMTRSPWIMDFRCWTWPEVAILGADQKGTRMWWNLNLNLSVRIWSYLICWSLGWLSLTIFGLHSIIEPLEMDHYFIEGEGNWTIFWGMNFFPDL